MGWCRQEQQEEEEEGQVSGGLLGFSARRRTYYVATIYLTSLICLCDFRVILRLITLTAKFSNLYMLLIIGLMSEVHIYD